MNAEDAMHAHDRWLDDVAVYVLGALSQDDAARVRAHLDTCPRCKEEYAALAPAAAALGYSAEACATGENGPHVPPSLKDRIMREIRANR